MPDLVFHRRESARKLIAALLRAPMLAGTPEEFRTRIHRLGKEVGLDASK